MLALRESVPNAFLLAPSFSRQEHRIGYLAINEVPVSINQGIIATICDGEIPNYYASFLGQEHGCNKRKSWWHNIF